MRRMIFRAMVLAILTLGTGLISGCGDSAPPTPTKHDPKDGGANRPRPEDGNMNTKSKARAAPVLND